MHPGQIIWVSVELKKLEDLNSKVQAWYSEKVMEYFANLKISELCNLEKQCDAFTNEYK
jgi:hypothetical protein